MLGKKVLVGTQAGTVTKEVGDNATGEVYEVEFGDGTTKEVSSHEMIISDPVSDITASPEEQLAKVDNRNVGYVTSESVQEGTGDGSGTAESKEEEVEEGKDEEYEKFFKAALEKFGVDSPADLEGDKKKEFFDYVDKNWKGEKKEEVVIEFTEAELAHFDAVMEGTSTKF
tara:strand:- start:3148 stop:3660 length:513 start_codon:yes stop_codon:yes gene_type:complete